MRLFFLAAISFMLIGCGPVNGPEPTPTGEFNPVGAVVDTSTNTWFGTAFLLQDGRLCTAGHVVDAMGGRNVSIVFGQEAFVPTQLFQPVSEIGIDSFECAPSTATANLSNLVLASGPVPVGVELSTLTARGDEFWGTFDQDPCRLILEGSAAGKVACGVPRSQTTLQPGDSGSPLMDRFTSDGQRKVYATLVGPTDNGEYVLFVPLRWR